MAADCADFYDAELARHNRHLRAAADIGTRYRVLDIGCGAGLTAREAARAAVDGGVLGVDTSGQMLEVARRRCAEEGLRNVTFEQGDAQSHAFPAASFDVCISRFGTMFFVDPPAAFANIAQALRPGARLVWMVWQSQERNEWSGAIQQALNPKSTPSGDVPMAFSLGDPAVARTLLSAAGFKSIAFTEVHEPVFYGPNVAAAFDALGSFQMVKEALARTTEPPGKVSQRLRDMLEAHMAAEGVLFDSRAWLITARRENG
ncbi:class I SAM-dependent methyltransferase [Mesorhizobium sp.]|uniref:class I SAM-dependent methyltransferase n=1 Tax=Mesorhizobium sp. TaxID=1871066 RepID=UPI000FE912B3|nr:class I SAM-dependent methyltransferase [Mesorhizobium sp.]RWA60083.1 MAG: class I SAM-dependent methyltransferase [Mesorhizobium sp.]RWA81451.1 MAG: class I SAM-dependent methyltransferase [Mesorhizobium sp.]